MNPQLPRVIFYTVSDNAGKLLRICKTVQDAMQKEKKLLIFVPNEEAGRYIDALLWRMPEDSFLPHIYSNINKNSKERVIITELDNNLNQASVLLNLKPSCSPLLPGLEEIHELYEISAPEKEQAA